jgi:hypothetical protein
VNICGQATKGAWGMSWRQKTMTGVEDCEKSGVVVKQTLQASTWSVRANGCRSRLPEASLNPGTNQYVRTMSSPSLPS